MTRTIAIVGRPNVGKSTLFNRLAAKKLALVAKTPGVTRDRREDRVQIGHLSCKLIDTAGLEQAIPGSMESRMQAQTEKALGDAELVLFLIDARAGVTPPDRHFATWLRKQSVPIILVANKCEGRAGEGGFYDAFSLGFGNPIAISAEHNQNVGDLIEAIETHFGALEVLPKLAGDADDEVDAKHLTIAVVGRPNVGKSTLINQLLGEERVITGPEAGLTRDAIPIRWQHGGRAVYLVDTAGMRRRARIGEALEKLSVSDTMKAIQFAEVVVVMVDVHQGLEKQDIAIAAHVVEEGRALVLALNKWDLVEEKSATRHAIAKMLETSLPQIRGLPHVPITARTGAGVPRLLEAIEDVFSLWQKRVSTGQLNRWLAHAVDSHPPPVVQRRRIRLRYMTQVKSRPPTFAVFASRATEIPKSYQRYLVNRLREDLGFGGVPLRLLFRKGQNPYA